MRSLSIKQPWASLIAHNIKKIENRTWKTNFRGRIYIHASAKRAGRTIPLLDTRQCKCLTENSWCDSKEDIKSAIIGEVDIIDCVINHDSIWAEKTDFSQEDPNTIWNWVLANAVLYENPILNVKGKLSFWEPDIDIVECIGCSQKFDSEFMAEDSVGEKYCKECEDILFPIMKKEYDEIVSREKFKNNNGGN